ncbi:MAG: hypothetical protein WBL85_09510 [Sedimentisphaerales bacterium]
MRTRLTRSGRAGFDTPKAGLVSRIPSFTLFLGLDIERRIWRINTNDEC